MVVKKDTYINQALSIHNELLEFMSKIRERNLITRTIPIN